MPLSLFFPIVKCGLPKHLHQKGANVTEHTMAKIKTRARLHNSRMRRLTHSSRPCCLCFAPKLPQKTNLSLQIIRKNVQGVNGIVRQ